MSPLPAMWSSCFVSTEDSTRCRLESWDSTVQPWSVFCAVFSNVFSDFANTYVMRSSLTRHGCCHRSFQFLSRIFQNFLTCSTHTGVFCACQAAPHTHHTQQQTTTHNTQHTTTHNNTQQHTTTHNNTQQHNPTHNNTTTWRRSLTFQLERKGEVGRRGEGGNPFSLFLSSLLSFSFPSFSSSQFYKYLSLSSPDSGRSQVPRRSIAVPSRVALLFS